MPPNPWGKGNPHGRNTELCENALDKENFIIFDFQKKGYKTMVRN
jgi:type I site-specific restriction endonuclease